MPGPKVRKFRHEFQPQPSSTAPAVPAAVQASLLQVGMRVRKSLSSSYRANWDKGLGSFSSVASLHRAKQETPTLILEDEDARMSAYDLKEPPSGLGLDSLSSSQESTASAASSSSSFYTTVMTPALPRCIKRRASSEEDCEEGDTRPSGSFSARNTFEELIAGDMMDSTPFDAAPTSLAPSAHLRALAQPKTRRRVPKPDTASTVSARGSTLHDYFKKHQLQQGVTADSMQEEDFGEAGFLVPL